jgi:PAS domain S-box-containing protein
MPNMTLLQNILASGLSDAMREDEKRRITLTNSISLILVGALLGRMILNFSFYDLEQFKPIVLFVINIIFLSPILLNRLGRIDASRIFLCLGPVIIIWLAASLRAVRNPMEIDRVFIYDGLRMFLLALSFIPYLIYDQKRPVFLVLLIFPTLVSILFYDFIFGNLIGIDQALANSRVLGSSLHSFRWILAFGIVSAGCFSFRRIIDKADAEREKFVAMLGNQTEEIRAQNEQLTKLSVVADKTTNAIAIFDKDGNFEWVNHGFVKVYDQTIDELLDNEGTNLFETIPNSYLNEEFSKSNDAEIKSILSKIEKCIKEKKPVHYEYYTITKGGNQIIVQTTLTPVLDAHGEIKNLVAIDTDISQLKKAEKEITQKKDEISEQAEELKKRNEEIEKQSTKLKQLYEEIKSISDNQEKIIAERTREITAQNDRIIRYAFMNAHKLRAPVARILGLTYLVKHDKSDVDLPEMFRLIDQEVTELDQIVREINKILTEEGIIDGDSGEV